MREKSISIKSRFSSRRVESQIDVSNDLKKYFDSLDFYSSYDAELTPVKGVLNIPALSIVLPLAWITGADVYVDELDETYAASMNTLQAEYKKIYPDAPFRTKLKIEKLVKSEDAPEGIALLFSGGLDSTYTLYNKISSKPRLIMIFGVADIPISNIEYQEKIKTEYSNFAKREGLEINFIQTNALELFYNNNNRINYLWERFQRSHEGNFWNGLGYSVGHISQAAPLSVGRFNRFIISASYNKTVSVIEHPDASSPDTDEKIAWMNLSVKHDGSRYRFEKTTYLKELLNSGRIKLRVCWSSPEYLYPYTLLNCGKCEKCLRTIAALCYSGVDPNKCGFNVDESNFASMKYMFEEKLLNNRSIEAWWKPLQEAIPEVIEDIHGSKNFFDWFKKMNLDLMARQPRNTLHSSIVKLPYPLWHVYRMIYRSIFPTKGSNIYQPIIPKEKID